MDKDEAKKLFAKSESIFKDLKGVKYKVDYKDKKQLNTQTQITQKLT